MKALSDPEGYDADNDDDELAHYVRLKRLRFCNHWTTFTRMVTITLDDFDRECSVDRCSGIAYCGTFRVCDCHKRMVTRYLHVCHKLNLPLLSPVKYDAMYGGKFTSDVYDTVEILFAALLFDTWATSAEDWELQILMKGI